MTGSSEETIARPPRSPESGAPPGSEAASVLFDVTGCRVGPAWGREIITAVEVGEQTRVHRLPSQHAPGLLGGRGVVQSDQHGREPEVRLQPVGGDGRGGQAQVVADALGDL